jgi:hypothetical protein
MITEKDYLKAKQIVQEYEIKYLNISDIRQRSIAVISLDAHDFKLWKNKNNLKHDELDTQKKFKVGNTTYYCISKVYDLCSLALDEITETEYAKENKEYGQIKLVARGNLTVGKVAGLKVHNYLFTKNLIKW